MQLYFEYPLLICTWILKFLVWKIKLDELDFLFILNWIFPGYTDSKNQVQNRQKIKFIELDFSNRNFKFQGKRPTSSDNQHVCLFARLFFCMSWRSLRSLRSQKKCYTAFLRSNCSGGIGLEVFPVFFSWNFGHKNSVAI